MLKLDRYRLEPIVSLRDGCVVGHEVLYGVQPLPSTSEVWREWYAYLANALESISESHPGYIAINVDTSHLLDPCINAILRDLAPLPMPLHLEWTEHRMGNGQRGDVLQAGRQLAKLRDDRGFRIVLDDLGAGEDMLLRLRAVRPDQVKLDGPMFHETRTNPEVRALVVKFLGFLNAMNLPVCIEWIETIQDLALARSLGGTFGQGYYWTLATPKLPLPVGYGEVV